MTPSLAGLACPPGPPRACPGPSLARLPPPRACPKPVGAYGIPGRRRRKPLRGKGSGQARAAGREARCRTLPGVGACRSLSDGARWTVLGGPCQARKPLVRKGFSVCPGWTVSRTVVCGRWLEPLARKGFRGARLKLLVRKGFRAGTLAYVHFALTSVIIDAAHAHRCLRPRCPICPPDRWGMSEFLGTQQQGQRPICLTVWDGPGRARLTVRGRLPLTRSS